jgi:hypothetical protein
MKNYLRLTNKTFYNEFFGMVKNIPCQKSRNFYLKKHKPTDKIICDIPVIKTRTTIKNLIKKQFLSDF